MKKMLTVFLALLMITPMTLFAGGLERGCSRIRSGNPEISRLG